MSWKDKRVLVTGAGGFIGSHLTERLVAEGASVRALVHYNAFGSWGWLDCSPVRAQVDVVAGDIRDADMMREVVSGREVVFHLAALIAIPYSYRSPASFVQTNVVGSLNLLQAASEAGVRRFVHTSTSEVYGTACYAPMDESHPLQGQSPYAASKIGADKLAESFHLSFGLPLVTVRPFNTFGPRQSDRAVIPTIIAQCLASERVALGSLETKRDFSFVDNTVEGFLLAGSAPDAVGQTFNLGSGREISVGEMARLIARLLGKAVVLEQKAERVRPEKSEVGRLLAATERARSVLAWSPRVGLEDGLERTIAWLREHQDHYRPGRYVI